MADQSLLMPNSAFAAPTSMGLLSGFGGGMASAAANPGLQSPMDMTDAQLDQVALTNPTFKPTADAIKAQRAPVAPKSLPPETMGLSADQSAPVAAGLNVDAPPPQAMGSGPSIVTLNDNTTNGIRPEARAELDNTASAMSDNAGTLQAAQDLRTTNAGTQTLHMEEDRAKDLATEEARRTAEAARIDEQRQALRDEIDKISQQRVDSNRLFKNMSTGDTVTAGVSLLLGGLAAGLAGTPMNNMVLNSMDKAITRDIDEQIKNIDIAHANVDAKSADLKRLIEITGSKQASRDYLRAKTYEGIKNQIDARKEILPPGEQKARAEQASLAIEAKHAETLAKAETYSNVSKQQAVKGTEAKGFEWKSDGQRQKSLDLTNKWQMVNDISKFKGQGRLIGEWAQLKSRLGQASAAEADQLQREMDLKLAEIKDITGKGMSNQEAERIMSVLPGMNDSPEAYAKKFENFKDSTEKEIHNFVQNVQLEIPGSAPQIYQTIGYTPSVGKLTNKKK